MPTVNPQRKALALEGPKARSSAPLPLEGVPARRPRCPGCGRARAANVVPVNASGTYEPHAARVVARRFKGWKGYGSFCTQRCAVNYANVVFRTRRLVLERALGDLAPGEWETTPDGFLAIDADRSELAGRARTVLEAARRDLGPELGGYSATDLLLDRLPELASVEDARALLRSIGEPTP